LIRSPLTGGDVDQQCLLHRPTQLTHFTRAEQLDRRPVDLYLHVTAPMTKEAYDTQAKTPTAISKLASQRIARPLK